MLAIIAPGFNAVSETFIADHARVLAPGATVLVCQNSTGAEAYGAPVLSHIAPRPTGFGRFDTLLKTRLFKLRRRLGIELPYDDRMRLAEFFRTHGVTRVLAEYGPVGMMVYDLCARMDLPLHVYFHGHDASALLRQSRFRKAYARMLPKVTGVFAASQHLIDNLAPLGCPLERAHVIPCGSDIASFDLGTPEPGRIFALGRLAEKKAPHLTIRAFGRIAADFPQAHLDLIGEGPLRAACEQEIREAGLEGRVTMHGAQPRPYWEPLLRRAAIFAQHSVTAADGDTEGSPVAINEAMATGLPVVATRHAGILRQVVEGETGYLVDEGDVEAMARAFAALLTAPDRAREMGLAGRARAEEILDQDKLFAQIRQVMGLPPVPPPPSDQDRSIKTV